MKDPFDYLLPDETLNNITAKDEHLFFIQKGKKVRIVYEDCVFDQQEIQKIKYFKQYSLNNNFNANDVPDKTIMRYLSSHNFENKETLQKLKIYLNWYSDPKIQREDAVTLQLINQGSIYTYGRDRSLRPVIYLNVGIMDIKKYSLEDYLAAINQVVNLVVDKMFIKGKLENYMFVIDMENKGIGSLPLGTVREIVLKLSYIYSMRMGRLLIINCNTFTKLMYSAVCPFLADITKKKVKILSQSQIQNGKILDFIHSDQLEKKYGGDLNNLDQKWPPHIPGKYLKTHQHQSILSKPQFETKQQTNLEEMYGQNSETLKHCCTANSCKIY